MSEILNLESARLVYPFAAPAARSGAPGPASTGAVERVTDRAEFSATATQLAESAAPSRQSMRMAKVARIRAEIQNGTYDVDGKLEAVLGRVLADVFA